MFFKFKVDIPVGTGKIIRKKRSDNSTYVLYEYDREYKKEKRYYIPKRAIIGKVSSDNDKQMYPNEKYLEFFSDAEIPEVLEERDRSCCLRIGSYIVINKILEEYKLKPVLQKLLGKDSGLFLDLLSFLIIDEDNAGQFYPQFAYNHPLFSEKMHIYSDAKVSRMLKSITRDQSIGFLNEWNKKRDRKQRIYISYDSTNKNCQAGDINILEYGKPKHDIGAPIFNLAVAFDNTNRIPLLYEEYPGSINDVSQFTFLVDKFLEYGYKDMGFILDRGYFSKENIQYMDDNGYEFIIMAKGCKAIVSPLIKENRNTFETERSCSIRSYRVYGKTVCAQLYADDRKQRWFHIYYNPGKQAGEREKLEQKLDKYKEFIEKHIGKEQTFGSTYQRYFEFKYDKKGRLLFAKEREDVIKEELELCGYFCIITSEEMTAEKALIKYKGRDISEKLFSADKSFIGSDSMRVHSSEAMSSKLFLEFVTLIIRNRIYNLLREEMQRIETKPNYFTVTAAISELEKIEMVRWNNGSYKLDHAVTKKQKDILSAFGIDVDYVKTKAREISMLLENNRCMNETDESEDEENGENEIH